LNLERHISKIVPIIVLAQKSLKPGHKNTMGTMLIGVSGDHMGLRENQSISILTG